MRKFIEQAWEITKIIFWLLVWAALIAYNHPKVQKMLASILPGRFQVVGDDKPTEHLDG